MTPDIHTFALRYLAKIGSVAQAEDGTYQFTLASQALHPYQPENWPFPTTIRFSCEPVEADDVHYLGLGSPLLREILENCQRWGALTYRHLLSDEVPTLSRFQEKLALPLAGMHCTGVQQQLAIGFVHQSSFEAPALGQKPEQTRLDVLCWDTGERLDGLSERLFDLVTTPGAEIPPPDPDRVDWLHERARYLSNYLTEKQGKLIEQELQTRLAEELERNRQYHDQQRAQLQEREHTLLARIEQLESKLQEAKTPLARERAQQDLESTWDKLRHLTDDIHRDLNRIHQAESAKAQQETARHELTVTTDLVNACLITFDMVTYMLEVQGGGQLKATFIPVTGELGLPTCAGCQRPPSALDPKGHPVCAECRSTCPRCPTVLCPDCQKDARLYGGCPDCHTAPLPQPAIKEPITVEHDTPAPHQQPGRIIDLPQMIRQRQAPPVQRKMCPQCGASQSPQHFSTCPCCGVGVCGHCRGEQHECQTCQRIAPPTQEPNWVKEIRLLHPEFAKIRQYAIAENKRYGVVQWKTFGGERVLVFDMWHRQVAMDRQKGLMTALKRVLT